MSLRNRSIFFIGTTKFDGNEQSTSFTIAKELSRYNTVYYIDYPFTFKDCFVFKGTDQLKLRKPYFSRSSDGIVQTDNPNFKVIIVPPLLSINFLPEGFLYRQLLKLNEKIIQRRLKKVIKKEKIAGLIYINSFNFHYPNIAGALKPALTIYQCVDPLIMSYDVKHGIVSENKLVRESDLVICTSRQLCNEKKLLNQRSYFIPNAADISHSSKALSNELPVHSAISRLKKPIIGYVGNIERRIDYPLLKEVVQNNKDKNFVFAGPVNSEFAPEWLSKTPNVHLLGHIPYDELPAVMKGIDIAIIPFKKDEVSATIFPLKLFEYLGAGKAVISTDFNSDLEEYTGGTVKYCKDAASFSFAIDEILANDTEDNVRSRIEIAQENTWGKRAEEILELIDSNLKMKNMYNNLD